MAVKIKSRNLNFYYGSHQALFDNNLDIEEHKITAVIGPSGCGKSTHLRIYNRIYELYREQRAEGLLEIDAVPHERVRQCGVPAASSFQTAEK